MTPSEAREILLLYRPGVPEDPDIAQALELAREDAGLRRWFEEHRAYQEAMCAKFGAIEAPAPGKARILAARAGDAPGPRSNVWWRQPASWAAAAAVVVLIALSLIWAKPRVPDRFTDYQGRMVRTALKGYSMDIVTNALAEVRRYMATHGGPADYVLPAGLEKLELTGGALLRWRNQPVSMICFDPKRSDNQMLFLFVLDHTAVKDPPPDEPALREGEQIADRQLVGCWQGLSAGRAGGRGALSTLLLSTAEWFRDCGSEALADGF